MARASRATTRRRVSLNAAGPASIRGPRLLPGHRHGIVRAQALAFETVGVVIVLSKHAPIEQTIDADLRDRCGASGVEDIPVADPEIELVVLRPVAGSVLRRLREQRAFDDGQAHARG